MPTISDLPDRWTVTIEVSGDLRARPVDATRVTRLIDVLGRYGASVSHLPRSYTTRLVVVAAEPLAAAAEALEVWRDAVSAVALPDWPVTHLDIVRVRRT